MASTINNDGDFTPISADIRLRANTSNGMPLTHDDVDGNFENLRLGHNAILDYLNSGLHISSAGEVGIGTTSPQSELHIESNVANHDTTLKIENRHGDTGGTAIEFQGYRDVDTDHWVAKIVADHVNSNVHGSSAVGSKLGFYTYDGNSGYGSPRMTIDQNGKVGIGTTSPAGLLELSKSTDNASLYITSSNTNSSRIYFGDVDDSEIGRINYNHAFDFMDFYVNGAEKMRIDLNGKVGIGTTDPGATLHVRANDDSEDALAFWVVDKAHTNSIISAFENGDVRLGEFIYEDSTGSVGIGTNTSPEGKLEISHTGSWDNPSIHLRGQHPTIKFNDTNLNEDDWYIHVNSSNFYILVDRDGSGEDSPIDADSNEWDAPHPLKLEQATNTGYLFGNEIWHAGNLDSDSFVRSNANDTVTGLLTMSRNGECLRLKGSAETSSPYVSFYQAGTSSDIRRAYIQFNDSTDTLNLYNDVYDDYLKIGGGSGGLQWNEGGADYTVYHSGNLPSYPSVSSASQKIQDASGSYGSVKVTAQKNNYAGYAINDDWVFMAHDHTQAGIYNDTDNEWAIRFSQNGTTELYHNGTGRLQTTNSGISVNGYVSSTLGLSSSIITSALNSTSAHVALSASAGKNLQDQINNLDATWSGGTIDANIKIEKSYPKLYLTNNVIQGGSFGMEFQAHRDLGTFGQVIETRAAVRYNMDNESLDITAPSSGGLRFNGKKVAVENQVDSRLVAFNDWFAAYGDDDPNNLTIDHDSRFASLQDDSDATIGTVYKAIDCRNSKQWSVSLRAWSNTASSSGFYIGIFFHASSKDLENSATLGTQAGVLALSHLKSSSEQPYVGEDGSVLWLRNNGSIGTGEETYHYTFDIPSHVRHFSVGILNWTDMGHNHLHFDPMVQINPVDPFYGTDPSEFAPSNYLKSSASDEHTLFGFYNFSQGYIGFDSFYEDGVATPSFEIDVDERTSTSTSRYTRLVCPGQNYGGIYTQGKTTDGTDQLGWWFNTTGTASDLNLYYAGSTVARTRSYGILAQSGVATIDSGYNYLGVSKRGTGALSIDSATSGIGCWDTTKDLTQPGYQSVATVYWEKNGRLVRLSIKISPDSQGFGLEEQGQVNYTGLPYTPSSTQPSVNSPAFGTWRVGNNHAGYYWDSPTTSIPHDLPCEILNGKLILRSPNFRGLDQTNSSTPIYVNISYITDSYN